VAGGAPVGSGVGGAADGASGGAGDEAAETAGQREARLGRISFEELRILLARALQRVKAFAAHERRAAHEAMVMEKLLQELDDTGCIIVADWKMKFLASSFREAMADFFGKSGMRDALS
jgi:hypothetical protein